MSQAPQGTDSLDENGSVRDKTEGAVDVSKARKPKSPKPKTVPAGPSSDAPISTESKKVLRKHGIIKSVFIPAKMSREDIGMVEKLTEYDKFEDKHKRVEDGTPEQTNRILQDSRDFLMHSLLLALVTTIAIYTVPLSRFYYHDILTHFLVDSTFITGTGLLKNFWEIVQIDQIWAYFSGILLPLVYSGVNGKIAASYSAMFKNPKDMLLINDNILVTPPRIRQVRVRNDSCEVLEGFEYLLDSCYSFFEPNQEDKEPFGLQNGTLWTYSDQSVTKASTVYGDVMEYTGGGYYMDFSPTLEKTLDLYNEMWDNTWIDHGTRAIIIDLTSYSQRDNLFCIATLLLELPPSGGVIANGDFRIQKLLRYESEEDLMILGFELALAALLILFTLDNIIKFAQQPLHYISNLWNAIDWLLLALGYAAVAVGVWRYFFVKEQLGGLLQAIRSKKHFSFYAVRDVQTCYENLIACFALVAWLKTCRFGALFRSGALVLRAFRKVRTELVALTLMLLVMIYGFGMLAHVLFGSDLEEFSTVGGSFFSLIVLFTGGLNYYNKCEEASPMLAPIFFMGYIFVVMILFVNWFVAVIVYGLKEAAREIDMLGEEIFIHDILKNAYKKCLLFCKCRKLYVEIDKKDLERPPDFEIIDSLLDRNGFSRLERDLFLRRHGISSEDLANGNPVNVEDVIADLNGINRYYVEIEEHERILKRIAELKERLELLDNTLADVIVKSDVLFDKHKLQEDARKEAKKEAKKAAKKAKKK